MKLIRKRNHSCFNFFSSFTGTFTVPITRFVEPKDERLVRPLDKNAVKQFKKMLVQQPKIISQCQPVIGNIPSTVVQREDFDVKDLMKYEIDAIDGNHSFHTQLAVFLETKNPLLANREVGQL